MASALAISPATAGAWTTSRCGPCSVDQNVRTRISNWSKRYERILSSSASRWSWNHDHTSRAATPCGDVELVPRASSMFGNWPMCRTLMPWGGAAIIGRATAPSDGDWDGTAERGPSPGPGCRRIDAWEGNELDGGRWDACAWDRRLAAVGVFSSGKTTVFAPLARLSELRFEAFAELGPSDSSSSSSSEPLPASACSLASRAAFTDCCAALLFDLRM